MVFTGDKQNRNHRWASEMNVISGCLKLDFTITFCEQKAIGYCEKKEFIICSRDLIVTVCMEPTKVQSQSYICSESTIKNNQFKCIKLLLED